jgi:N-sulfoglucosamine sulfohydrolase
MPLQPNILYIHSHDTGRWLQPYGHPISTPHLQRFAEQGILYRQAFAVSPTCSPSRAALLTGRYPHQCGMNGLTSLPWNYQLNDPRQLLMHYLGALGYVTALAGVQHVTQSAVAQVRGQGFSLLLNEDNLGEDIPDLHERAGRFIAQTPKDKPWFLSVGFDQTHRDSRQGEADSGRCFSQPDPYDPAAIDSRYCLPPPTIPDLPETRADMASFKEGARLLDQRIGHILAALDRSGSAGNTLVIITTDHGIAWPGMKCTLSDHGLGVNLMLRGPGGFAGGRVIDALVTHLDIFPTLCDLLSTPPPTWLEGKSLIPLTAETPTARIHEEIFAEQDWHEVPEPQRAIRTQRYKYIRRFDPIGPKIGNCDEGPTKRVLESIGFFDRALGPELLFDLFLDPQEACNLAEHPAAAEILSRMRKALEAWMRRTRDPLISGQSVTPPGLEGAISRQARIVEDRSRSTALKTP